MSNILSPEETISLATQQNVQGKRIVLVGGCFDILHIGHLTFLQKAKEQGDLLFVLIESDESIKKTKGTNRPINSQKDRAEIVSQLKMVDAVITLPVVTTDECFLFLMLLLFPASG